MGIETASGSLIQQNAPKFPNPNPTNSLTGPSEFPSLVPKAIQIDKGMIVCTPHTTISRSKWETAGGGRWTGRRMNFHAHVQQHTYGAPGFHLSFRHCAAIKQRNGLCHDIRKPSSASEGVPAWRLACQRGVRLALSLQALEKWGVWWPAFPCPAKSPTSLPAAAASEHCQNHLQARHTPCSGPLQIAQIFLACRFLVMSEEQKSDFSSVRLVFITLNGSHGAARAPAIPYTRYQIVLSFLQGIVYDHQ